MLTLLKLISDGQFHSGQALGAVLGISRTAVWKKLQNLQSELGLEIDRIPGRGYRLVSPIKFLDVSSIQSFASNLIWPLYIFESLDSTNAEALRMISANVRAPYIVTSERQLAGRGRRGRAWVSPFAKNLYYSLVLRVEGGARAIDGLSLVVGLAVLRALRAAGIKGIGLKWPNDLLVGRNKIAGILLELVGDPADVCHVVIGIGINVNMRAEAAIDQPWTSMLNELGASYNRNALMAALSDELRDLLAKHQLEGFSAIRAEWEAGHLWQGKNACLIAGSSQVNGVVVGVDDAGALRMAVDGIERLYSGGELSLRLQE